MNEKELEATLMAYEPSELEHREAYIKYMTARTALDADKPIDYGIVVKKPIGARLGLIKHDRFSLPDYHTHEYVELLWIYRGEFLNAVEGSPTVLREGDVCLLTPGVYHFVDVLDARRRSGCAAVNLLIYKETAAELFLYIKGERSGAGEYLRCLLYEASAPQYRLYTGVSDECRALLSALTSVMLDNRRSRETSALHLLCAALLWLDSDGAARAENSPLSFRSADPVNAIIQYIYANCRTVTLCGLAEAFNYAPAYLCRMLKKRRGTSFKRLLTDVRLSRACFLLSATSEQVCRIAAEVGYENAEHFHRLFKRVRGMTPGEYRAVYGVRSI